MLQQHPLSKLFPPMSAEDFQELLEDIRRQGVLEPIELLDGMVLDGWHRYTACQQLGIECPTRPWTNTDGTEAAFQQVWARNALRRHLTAAQKIQIAAAAHPKDWAEVGTQAGKRPPPDRDPEVSAAARMAAVAGVNEDTVRRAKQLEQDAPDLWKRATSGEMSLREAHAQRLGRKVEQTQQGQKVRQEKKEMEWNTHFVKEVIKKIDAIRDVETEIQKGLAHERFAPEAKPFVIRRLEKAVTWLVKAQEELSR